MGLDPHAGDWGDALEQLIAAKPAGSRSGSATRPRSTTGRAEDEDAAVATLPEGRAPRARARAAPALGPEGARGATARRGEQGHRGAHAARRARAAPCALRRRRRDRPGGVPRARRARRGGARRGRLGGGTERARRARPISSSARPRRSSSFCAGSDAPHGRRSSPRSERATASRRSWSGRARSPSASTGSRPTTRGARTTSRSSSLNGERLALIRKHPFPPDIWRPPGGGVKPGEDFVEAVVREAYEETGLRVTLERYLVEARARFLFDGRPRVADARLPRDDGRTRSSTCTTPTRSPRRAGARSRSSPGRCASGCSRPSRAFWRYRVALHDAALAAL